jgi:hypothetical protein
MLMRLWRQQPQRPAQLEAKIYTAKAMPVAIPLPTAGKRYPVIRTNGLPIYEFPKRCGSVVAEGPITFQALNEQRHAKQPDLVATYSGQVLFWGGMDEATRLFSEQRVTDIETHEFEDPIGSISSSSVIKSFFEEGLVRSLCNGKPVVVRRKDRTWFAVVDHRESKNALLTPMRGALANNNTPLNGPVPKLVDTFWAECVSIHLEERNGGAWLMIRPDVWISPLAHREQAKAFLREKKLRRWNPLAYRLLDAWIALLVGSVGAGHQAQISCFQNTRYPVSFTLNTRSGYSGGGGASG